MAQSADESGIQETAPHIFLTTLFLTLTNPATILSFTAIFAGTGIVTSQSNQAVLMVIGIFSGSMLWWILLATGISIVRRGVTERTMRWINRGSGIIIAGIGIIHLFGQISG